MHRRPNASTARGPGLGNNPNNRNRTGQISRLQLSSFIQSAQFPHTDYCQGTPLFNRGQNPISEEFGPESARRLGCFKQLIS